MASMTDFFPTMEVKTTTTIEGLRKLYDAYDVEYHSPTSAGMTTTFVGNDENVAIVYIDATEMDMSTCALIVHEAMHCAQRYMSMIGEDEPSIEFYAYTVQSFYSLIHKAVAEQLGVE